MGLFLQWEKREKENDLENVLLECAFVGEYVFDGGSGLMLEC